MLGNDESATSANEGAVSLALSGGGYRAAAFHLGALRRLNENGLLARVNHLSSVSGGSILAAHLAQCMVDLGLDTISFGDWEEQVAAPFRERILRQDIRTAPFLKQWLLPWNWFRSGPAVKALERQYARHLTRLALEELPETVRFTFCATDLFYGVNWVFERGRAGDYRSGHTKSLASAPVARAVAASSCFPPVFLPMKLKLERKDASKRPSTIQLTDGGVYDNLGLEPVWKGKNLLLLSDGGAPFSFKQGTSPIRRLTRYNAIATNQAISLHWRWLVARFLNGELVGTTWRIDQSARDIGTVEDGLTYSEDFARDCVARIRTDMDGFSKEEIGVLENHGYALAEASTRKWIPETLDPERADSRPPHADLLDENALRPVLAGSSRRHPVASLVHFLLNPIRPFRSRLS